MGSPTLKLLQASDLMGNWMNNTHCHTVLRGKCELLQLFWKGIWLWSNYLKHVAFHLATWPPTADPRNMCAQRRVPIEASVAMTPLLVKARHGKQSWWLTIGAQLDKSGHGRLWECSTTIKKNDMEKSLCVLLVYCSVGKKKKKTTITLYTVWLHLY